MLTIFALLVLVNISLGLPVVNISGFVSNIDILTLQLPVKPLTNPEVYINDTLALGTLTDNLLMVPILGNAYINISYIGSVDILDNGTYVLRVNSTNYLYLTFDLDKVLPLTLPKDIVDLYVKGSIFKLKLKPGTYEVRYIPLMPIEKPIPKPPTKPKPFGRSLSIEVQNNMARS